MDHLNFSLQLKLTRRLRAAELAGPGHQSRRHSISGAIRKSPVCILGKMTFLKSSCLLLGLSVMMTTVSATGIEVGSPFPSLTLPSLRDGSPHSIKDWRGKKIVLHIWASW